MSPNNGKLISTNTISHLTNFVFIWLARTPFTASGPTEHPLRLDLFLNIFPLAERLPSTNQQILGGLTVPQNRRHSKPNVRPMPSFTCPRQTKHKAPAYCIKKHIGFDKIVAKTTKWVLHHQESLLIRPWNCWEHIPYYTSHSPYYTSHCPTSWRKQTPMQ